MLLFIKSCKILKNNQIELKLEKKYNTQIKILFQFYILHFSLRINDMHDFMLFLVLCASSGDM